MRMRARDLDSDLRAQLKNGFWWDIKSEKSLIKKLFGNVSKKISLVKKLKLKLEDF
jgi:hypothetical protein